MLAAFCLPLFNLPWADKDDDEGQRETRATTESCIHVKYRKQTLEQLKKVSGVSTFSGAASRHAARFPKAGYGSSRE